MFTFLSPKRLEPQKRAQAKLELEEEKCEEDGKDEERVQEKDEKDEDEE